MSIVPSVVVVGGDTLVARLKGASQGLKDILRDRLSNVALTAREQMVAAINSRTGQLASALQAEVYEFNNGVGAVFSVQGVPYARIIEEGGTTPPHEIVPINVKALCFHAAYGIGLRSDLMFATKVQHPGGTIAGQHYIRNTLRDMIPVLNEEIRQALEEALNA